MASLYAGRTNPRRGDGDNVADWSRYVAVTQMHGHGSFTERDHSAARLTRLRRLYSPLRETWQSPIAGDALKALRRY